MQIKDIIPLTENQLDENPIQAIGSTIGAIAKLKSNLGNWKDASALYFAFKRYARTPAKGTDTQVVQEFLLDSGFPADVIKRAVEKWKKKERITPEAISSASGSAKRKIPSLVTDKQIRSFFSIVYDEVNSKLPDVKGAKGSKFVDSFDQDREDIIATAEAKFGLKDGVRVAALAQKNSLAQMRKDPELLQALAAIGYTTLRF